MLHQPTASTLVNNAPGVLAMEEVAGNGARG
nr:hypothetical protein RKHAN_02968 [Rhizobium sp. Khangiran2]